MRNFLSIAYLAILICCTLLALRTWFTRRGASVEQAEKQVFNRFVLGIIVFWLVAVVGFLGGFFSFPG
jgi:hypothetical protein